MAGLFITATGTGIGKTLVTALLTRAAIRAGNSVLAIKPIVSGFDDRAPAETDPGILIDAMGRPLDAATLDYVAPWRFAAPIAPHMAAKREGRVVPYGDMLEHCSKALGGPEDMHLIEGIGGIMAPVDDDHTVLDWISALSLPAILVAGTYVGTISHTLTALASLRAAGIRVCSVVLSESDEAIVTPQEQAEAIGRFAGGVPIHILPRIAGDAPWRGACCDGLARAVLGRVDAAQARRLTEDRIEFRA